MSATRSYRHGGIVTDWNAGAGLDSWKARVDATTERSRAARPVAERRRRLRRTDRRRVEITQRRFAGLDRSPRRSFDAGATRRADRGYPDITRRKQAERSVIVCYRRWPDQSTHWPACCSTSNAGRRLNPAGARIFRYTRDEMLHMSPTSGSCPLGTGVSGTVNDAVEGQTVCDERI